MEIWSNFYVIYKNMSYETVPLRKNIYSIEKDRTETWNWDKIKKKIWSWDKKETAKLKTKAWRKKAKRRLQRKEKLIWKERL